MPRYIDTDTLYKLGHYDDFEKYVVDWEAIDNAPTADVVEVVRCKDCKHYIRHDKRCGLLNHGGKTDFFCGWGERREDE